MISTLTEPFDIVLIEDDFGHAELIRRNLKRSGVANPIVQFASGELAIAHFLGGGRVDRRLSKSVVLLDLNLPDMDGFEVLRRLKLDPATRAMPVVILTTTDHPGDVDRGYAMGCNVFITKPVSHEAFADAIHKLGLMLTTVRVPHVLS